jgi:hypothetical protein
MIGINAGLPEHHADRLTDIGGEEVGDDNFTLLGRGDDLLLG